MKKPFLGPWLRMREMKAAITNQITGEIVLVESTTEHSASSYGKAVWISETGECFGQVDMPVLGFSLEILVP